SSPRPPPSTSPARSSTSTAARSRELLERAAMAGLGPARRATRSKSDLDHGVLRDVFREVAPRLATGQADRLETLEPDLVDQTRTAFIDQIEKPTGRPASAFHVPPPYR